MVSVTDCGWKQVADLGVSTAHILVHVCPGWFYVYSRPTILVGHSRFVMFHFKFCHVYQVLSKLSTVILGQCFVAFSPFYNETISKWIPLRLPWQIFWQFKNLPWQPRQATFVNPFPLCCLTVTPFCPWWPETWMQWPPGNSVNKALDESQLSGNYTSRPLILKFHILN